CIGIRVPLDPPPPRKHPKYENEYVGVGCFSFGRPIGHDHFFYLFVGKSRWGRRCPLLFDTVAQSPGGGILARS
ncbi:unnamed protein product, partial [Ectocarpus sp. 8 AP-2014]